MIWRMWRIIRRQRKQIRELHVHMEDAMLHMRKLEAGLRSAGATEADMEELSKMPAMGYPDELYRMPAKYWPGRHKCGANNPG